MSQREASLQGGCATEIPTLHSSPPSSLVFATQALALGIPILAYTCRRRRVTTGIPLRAKDSRRQISQISRGFQHCRDLGGVDDTYEGRQRLKGEDNCVSRRQHIASLATPRGSCGHGASAAQKKKKKSACMHRQRLPSNVIC